MQRRPHNGITLDFEDGGGWSSQPRYALRENHCRAVTDAGASDSVIEGIESPRYRFCLGVQWHPEYILSDADRSIFQASAADA